MTNLKNLQYRDNRTTEEINATKPESKPLPFTMPKPIPEVQLSLIEIKLQDRITRQEREIKKLTNQLRNAMLTIKSMGDRINALERLEKNSQRW